MDSPGSLQRPLGSSASDSADPQGLRLASAAPDCIGAGAHRRYNWILETGSSDYPSQSPRSRAPQVAQGPASDAAGELELPTTAKTESSFSTSGLPQFLQVAVAVAELTIFSNFVPQLRH